MTAITHTPLALVRDHVEDWRRANRWSRETAAQAMVEAHERLGFDHLTGIHFDPPTRDTFERTRVNADRIFRWLDDSTKDRNLLPINFLWSVLAALPIERRLALVESLLAPVGLEAREEIGEFIGMDFASGPDQTVLVHFQAVVATAADAQVAMAQMADGIDPGEPEAAHTKLSRAAAAFRRALGVMNWLRRREKTPGGTV